MPREADDAPARRREALRTLAAEHLARREVVLVDPSFGDDAALRASVGRGVPIVALPDAGGAGALLAALPPGPFEAVHLFTSGGAETFALCGETVRAEVGSAGAAEGLRPALAPPASAGRAGATLHLYGCAFGEGDAGRRRAAALARTLAISVAATKERGDDGTVEPAWHLRLLNDRDAADRTRRRRDTGGTGDGAPSRTASEPVSRVRREDARPGASGPTRQRAPFAGSERVRLRRRETAGPEPAARPVPKGFGPVLLCTRPFGDPTSHVVGVSVVPTGGGPIHARFAEPHFALPDAAHWRWDGGTPAPAAPDAGHEAGAHLARPSTTARPDAAPATRARPSGGPDGTYRLPAFTLEAMLRPDSAPGRDTAFESGEGPDAVSLTVEGPVLSLNAGSAPDGARAAIDLTTLGYDDPSAGLLHVAGAVREDGWVRLYVEGALAGAARLGEALRGRALWTLPARPTRAEGFRGDLAMMRLHGASLDGTQMAAASRAARDEGEGGGEDAPSETLLWDSRDVDEACQAQIETSIRAGADTAPAAPARSGPIGAPAFDTSGGEVMDGARGEVRPGPSLQPAPVTTIIPVPSREERAETDPDGSVLRDDDLSVPPDSATGKRDPAPIGAPTSLPVASGAMPDLTATAAPEPDNRAATDPVAEVADPIDDVPEPITDVPDVVTPDHETGASGPADVATVEEAAPALPTPLVKPEDEGVSLPMQGPTRPLGACVLARPGQDVLVDMAEATGCTLRDTVAWWPVSLPPWLSINALRGTLHGRVPADHGHGAVALSATVANATGALATLSLNLVVEGEPMGEAEDDAFGRALRTTLDALPALRALDLDARAERARAQRDRPGGARVRYR